MFGFSKNVLIVMFLPFSSRRVQHSKPARESPVHFSRHDRWLQEGVEKACRTRASLWIRPNRILQVNSPNNRRFFNPNHLPFTVSHFIGPFPPVLNSYAGTRQLATGRCPIPPCQGPSWRSPMTLWVNRPRVPCTPPRNKWSPSGWCWEAPTWPTASSSCP